MSIIHIKHFKMKKFNPSVFPGLLILATIFTACSKSAVEPNANTVNNTAATVNAIASGNWVISSYKQRTEDKTSQFSGYVFSFITTGTNGGTITAIKSNNPVNGSWAYSPAVTYYGSTSTTSMTLNFGVSSLLDKISKKWNVVSIDSALISFVNPEVLEDEHLVFSKQ